MNLKLVVKIIGPCGHFCPIDLAKHFSLMSEIYIKSFTFTSVNVENAPYSPADSHLKHDLHILPDTSPQFKLHHMFFTDDFLLFTPFRN